MSRRSAQNPRYRKDAELGKTRRSAASAKPKRSVGSAGGSGGSAKKSDSKGKSSAYIAPDTPEYKRWRTIWFASLAGAVVFSLLGLLTHKTVPTVGTISLALAYALIFGGFFVDLTKLRPMRQEWQQAMKSGKKPKTKTSDTETKE